MKNSFYQLTFKELCSNLSTHSLSESGAKLLYNWHYKKKRIDPCTHNLALDTIALIDKQFHFQLPSIVQTQFADDKTVKFLVELTDGEKIEMVLIPFQNKYTLCLSTQVGCAMKCSFCYTGTQGLKRNLACEEIIGQFIIADRWLSENRPDEGKLRNIVFMGQGEPLHNFDAVKKSCEILLDQHGASLGAQRITISTAGYLPGLLRWKDEMPGVNIALSLHSVDDEKRSKLIPINHKYPLAQIMEVINSLPLARKQYVIFEYLLIDEFNDSEEDALKLGQYLDKSRSIVNLIPYNPIPNSHFKRPSDEKVDAFKAILDAQKIPALIRGTKGDSILAACGQLNSKSH
jgi:23S rRNA (adenine2503-C2)-methyltransferase